MTDINSQTQRGTRPAFPKRAIVTGGMPYGSKDLHFGHVGGVFAPADIFARFLRDRIGAKNVIFVSGTDCYGSPIVEEHRKQTEKGQFTGNLQEFVEYNHERQKKTLNAYNISLNVFAASGLGRFQEIHRELGADIFKALYDGGHLEKRTTPQFYDVERGSFLNGRQVVGRCPVQGCKSESAYADECSLGHQYEPKDLIAPKSTLSGNRPEMRDVTNWYVRVPAFAGLLKPWLEGLRDSGKWRAFSVSSVLEHFEPPILHVTRDQLEKLQSITSQLPAHEFRDGKAQSVQLVFGSLDDLEKGRAVLAANGLRSRQGKTLVPFRLTGNLDWGLPVPELDGLAGLTFWVWPESLWAPISFTAAYIEKQGGNKDDWKQWWCSKDATVYQFIGEDNVYFYGLAEMAMFLGMQGKNPQADPPDGQLQLPVIVANRHMLFLDKKASSSAAVKPPMATDLLNYYTADQLRAHFISLALGVRAMSFRPKPLNPESDPRESDPVLKEGFLLSNAFNRAARSCFYTAQKYSGGMLPAGTVSADVVEKSRTAILAFEAAMAAQEFHTTISILDEYIRDINQRWSRSNPYNDDCDPEVRRQALVDAFHAVRVATTLLHPIAPAGTELVREYLCVGDELWDWERIFEPLSALVPDASSHKLKYLEPKTDFFEKHAGQV